MEEFDGGLEAQNRHDSYLDDYTSGANRRGNFDATGHIYIEVTREKTEGYDIINVEYKNGCERDDNEHDCRLSEARNKLENIISFLNRYR